MVSVFQFEQDFAQTMDCIPMATRFKLDRCGIKLKLKEWIKFKSEERNQLLSKPCEGKEEIEIYCRFVRDLTLYYTGGYPETFDPPENPDWATLKEVPQVLIKKAESEGVSITLEQWVSLSPLQRFALTKLSRPSHANKNFLPAIKEFFIEMDRMAES